MYCFVDREVLHLLGMVPMPNGTVGVEGAGHVTRAGHDCPIQPGECLFGWIGDNFCSYSCCPVEAALRAPAGLGFEQTATMYTAWLTIDHALGPLSSNLLPSEMLLVHTATGSVGIATLWMAQAAGAAVVATAGNDSKRAWLSAQALSMVSSSRSPDRMRADLFGWFGSGPIRSLDAVTNALSNDFVAFSLDHLRAGGRFGELGKREIWSVEQVACP